MYHSPLDRLVGKLRQAEIAIRNATSELVDRGTSLDDSTHTALRSEIEDIESRIRALAERVTDEASCRRRDIAVDRAWSLVQLRSIAGLDQGGYYELAQFCNPMIQQQMGFDADLRAELEKPELIKDILDKTVFTFCVAGVFQW